MWAGVDIRAMRGWGVGGCAYQCECVCVTTWRQIELTQNTRTKQIVRSGALEPLILAADSESVEVCVYARACACAHHVLRLHGYMFACGCMRGCVRVGFVHARVPTTTRVSACLTHHTYQTHTHTGSARSGRLPV